MKKYQLFSFLVLLLGLSSCELIGDIFQAGMAVGVIAVVLVIALVLFVLRKIF
jgi:hypothetical protein